jgi:hypothetical protein
LWLSQSYASRCIPEARLMVARPMKAEPVKLGPYASGRYPSRYDTAAACEWNASLRPS